MLEYLITNHLMGTAFRFEYIGVTMNKLVYDPFIYDFFKEQNIDFHEELTKILLQKNFHKRLGITELSLKGKVEKLPFEKEIVFDFGSKEIKISKES